MKMSFYDDEEQLEFDFIFLDDVDEVVVEPVQKPIQIKPKKEHKLTNEQAKNFLVNFMSQARKVIIDPMYSPEAKEEVWNWVNMDSNDERDILAFNNLCSALGLNTEWMRKNFGKQSSSINYADDDF